MMLTELETRYPDHDWAAMEILPIIFISGTGAYIVNTDLWPHDTYPTTPSSEEIASWVEAP